MFNLTNEELVKIDGGSKIYTPIDLIQKIYRTIRIRILMKRLFID